MEKNKELQKSILLGDLEKVKSLLKNATTINEPDKYGRIVLYDAIAQGLKDIAIELCLRGANVNNQDKNGKTPLHFASISNQYEIAKILIQYGANVNLRDKNGNTPIFDAIFNSKGNPDIILLLKENKADYLTNNNYGISPKKLAQTIANFDVSYIFD